MVITLRATDTSELAPRELFRTFMMYLPIDQTSYTYLKNWPLGKPLNYWGLKTHDGQISFVSERISLIRFG
jgi:hypothetical protein